MAEAQTVNVQQACALLKKSERWVQMRAKEGYIKNVKGKYELISLFGVIDYYEMLLAKASKSAAASRVTDARTREIELRIDERQRLLIPVEDARGVVAEHAAIARAEMLSLPAKITREMGLRRKIEHEVNQSLSRMAAKAKAAIIALADGGGDLATDA
jgi:hypothetical protein